jgi:hypothetical protein
MAYQGAFEWQVDYSYSDQGVLWVTVLVEETQQQKLQTQISIKPFGFVIDE